VSLHAELARLVVHLGDEHREAARIGAAEGVRGAVLRRHQRQVEHVAARQRGADLEPRAAALLGVDVVVGDRDHLVEGQVRLGDDDRGHQLGDRGDRQHRLGVLGEQHLVGVLVEHQGDARLELERIGFVVQAGKLAERRMDRLDPDQGHPAQGAVAAADHDHGGVLARGAAPWRRRRRFFSGGRRLGRGRGGDGGDAESRVAETRVRTVDKTLPSGAGGARSLGEQEKRARSKTCAPFLK
jgi:hypothetical protein